MRAFWWALAFLTRLPTPRLHPDDAAAQSRALVFYPLVGAIIGGALSAVHFAGSAMELPPLMLAVLVLALWVWMSGGLHLDGLADCADAWAGGQGQPERTLRILKDPAAGPMGVIAIALVLLLKLGALSALPPESWTWLWWIPALGRALAVALFLTTPYVRPSGLGSALALAPRRSCLLGLALCVGAGGLLGAHGIAALVVGALVLWRWRRDCLQRLGGFTGDAAGAVIERGETSALLAACLVALQTA